MALIAGYGTYVVKKEKKNLKNEIQKCNCQKGEGECKHGNGCCGGHGDGQCKHVQCKNKSSPSECIVGIME